MARDLSFIFDMARAPFARPSPRNAARKGAGRVSVIAPEVARELARRIRQGGEARAMLRGLLNVARLSPAQGAEADRFARLVGERRFARPSSLATPEAAHAKRLEILEIRTADAVEAESKQCEFRVSECSWAGGTHTISVGVGLAPAGQPGAPFCMGYAERAWSRNGKYSGNNSRHLFRVPANWRRAVLAPGIARPGEGLLTLEAIPLPDRARGGLRFWRAAVARQGRGFDLVLEWGIIASGPDGSIGFFKSVGEAAKILPLLAPGSVSGKAGHARAVLRDLCEELGIAA